MTKSEIAQEHISLHKKFIRDDINENLAIYHGNLENYYNKLLSGLFGNVTFYDNDFNECSQEEAIRAEVEIFKNESYDGTPISFNFKVLND